MNKLIKLLPLLLVLIAAPALAQAISGGGAAAGIASVTGTLTNNGDTVVLPISGGQWATAKLTFGAVGTSAYLVEASIDGGTNYLASGSGMSYGKRLDQIGGNPPVVAFNGYTPTANSAWEFPLPGNATHVRIRCNAPGTTTTVTLSGGALYTPGMPVTAVLYDVTSAVNTPLDTGTLDMSGWTSSSLDSYVNTATPAAAVITAYLVDDAGGFNGGGQTIGYSPANVPRWRLLFGGSASAGYTSGDAAINPVGCLPKRVQFKAGAIATFTSRLRVEARR